MAGMTVALLPLVGCRNMSRHENDGRWARKAHIHEIDNCYEIAPGIYRSAQPSIAGFAELEKAGGKSVLCLCSGYPDVLASSDTMIRVHYVHLNPLHLRDEDIASALRVMSSASERPLLVHCHHGSDRTGAVCAAYRIVFQGWSKEDAIAEMTRGGFGYHRFLPNIIKYIRNLDVDAMLHEVSNNGRDEL